MLVHLIKGFEQALAAITVQFGDALPQPGDGCFKICLFGAHALNFTCNLIEHFLGPEIDAAKTLTIRFQSGNPGIDFRQIRNGFVILQPGNG